MSTCSTCTSAIRRPRSIFDESPEGHHLRFDGEGKLVGITLLHPRSLLERKGRITITIPEHVEEVGPEALSGALAAA
jgi:hypothetical protein